MLGKRAGRVGNRRMIQDHPNYSIIEIGKNTEKTPGDLRRLGSYSDSSERPSANAGVKNSLEI